MTERDGWTYGENPCGGDCRKLVTLLQHGMEWVGIRAFHHESRRWQNNNEPETATIKAWRDLPPPAQGFFDRGQLRIPTRSSDGLLQPMPAPTLPEGDGYS